MATSDAPLNVPNVTLAVARGGAPKRVSAFSISSPSGMSDGNEITISATSGAFGVGPSQKAAMGFGAGPIHNLTVGTPVPSHVDPITGSNWTFSGTRTVSEDADGSRWIKKGALGGAFYFDPGRRINPEEAIFSSSIVRGTAETSNIDGGTQWKTVRFQDDSAADTVNSLYFSTFEDVASTYQKGQIIVRYGHTGVNYYNSAHPTLDGRKVQQIVFGVMGNTDEFDSTVSTECMWPSASPKNYYGGAYNGNKTWNAPTGYPADGYRNITSEFPERWRNVFFQDYVNYATGVVIERKDIWVQIGSKSHSRIADTASPTNETESYILPEKSRTSGQVVLHLWKGGFSDYLNKFIHHYDDSGEFLASEALNNG